MPRIIMAGLSLIAILLTACLAAIALATREASPSGPSTEPRPSGVVMAEGTPAAPAAGGVLRAPAATPSGGGEAVSSPGPLSGSFPSAEPRRAAHDRSLKAGISPARRRALSSLRRELIAGVSDLRRKLAACAGSEAVLPVDSQSPTDRATAARSELSLTLAVESVKGGVRVVDARAEPPGSVTEAALQCARAQLKGQVIAAPSAEPGSAWQMPLSL